MSPEASGNPDDPRGPEPSGVDRVPVYDDKAQIRDTIDLSDAVWLRSHNPESGTGADTSSPDEEESGTLEIAFVGDYIAMRDSSKPEGPFLIYTQTEWDAFVAGVKDGEFDFEG